MPGRSFESVKNIFVLCFTVDGSSEERIGEDASSSPVRREGLSRRRSTRWNSRSAVPRSDRASVPGRADSAVIEPPGWAHCLVALAGVALLIGPRSGCSGRGETTPRKLAVSEWSDRRGARRARDDQAHGGLAMASVAGGRRRRAGASGRAIPRSALAGEVDGEDPFAQRCGPR